MADLSTILKDPAFVNANPATQQAIFDKWAPQDPNFANANAETQTAIRQKFGIPVMTPTGGPRMTGSLADQIPGSDVKAPAAIQPIPAKDFTFGQKVMGALETVPALVTSAVTAPLVEGSKIYGALTSGKFGTQAGIRAGEETGRKVQEQFYQPRTAAGQQYVGDIGNALASTGLQGVPMNVLADFQRGMVPATRAVTDLGGAKIAQRAENIALQQSNKDYQRSSQIDAAQAAKRLGGVALNPADSNPNVKTKLLVNAAGDSVVNAKAAKANAPRWNALAREDLGLPENTPLTGEAFDKARSAHAAPYDAIRNIGVMKSSDDVMSELGGLKLDPLSTSSPEKAAKVNAVVDRVIGQVENGLSGENVVGQIRGFRKDANQVLKNPNASPIDIDVAETNLSIANALENLVESNISNPKALDDFRKARTAIAKTYDWERATGVTTKQVDPLQIAKLAEKGKPLTGKLADIANVAGNFPDIATLTSPADPLLYQRLRRGGAGGTVGFVLGGGPVGAAIGAGLTSLGGEGTANLLARPGVQNRLAIPQDRRIPLPVEPKTPMAPIPQNRAIVPYDYSQQAFTPPNFVMQGEQYGPRVATPGFAPGPAQLPAPSAEGTMNMLRTEDARRAAMSRTLGQQAEQQAAAAETAARQPARGGMVLDIDPVTGKLVPGAEGTRGMTPDIQIIESTGKSLSGAADLLASGKSPALMSAEQKIAWDKTKVDLADVVPGMKTLNDKAIAAKMQDRAWVQDAITKAQDKARAFQDIAAKASNERLRQDALMKREQMLDLLENLEGQFAKARPVKTGGQGPKTRAFQRNMLSPEQEIQNALAK
jgi:hypothetical protein